MNATRIVLVKPGDILMFGNVTVPKDEEALATFASALHTLKETLGLAHDILIFEDDLDIASSAACYGDDRTPARLSPAATTNRLANEGGDH